MDIALKQYIVIINDNKKTLISSKEFEEMDIHRLLNSDNIKIKFYNKLPKGIYEFQEYEIEVDEYGEISILGTKQMLSRREAYRKY